LHLLAWHDEEWRYHIRDFEPGFTNHLAECRSAAKSTKASLRIHNKSLQGVIKSSLR
jgi:hypothetical protein